MDRGSLWLDLFKTLLAGGRTVGEAEREADDAVLVVVERRKADGSLLRLLRAVEVLGASNVPEDLRPAVLAACDAADLVRKGRAS